MAFSVTIVFSECSRTYLYSPLAYAALVVQAGMGRHLWDVPFSTFNINFMKVQYSEHP